MATGPNQILLKKSDVPGGVPSGLSFGEPAVNVSDGVLFFDKQTNGTVDSNYFWRFHGTTNESIVTSANGLTGAVLVKSGTNITVTSGAGGITIDAFGAGSNVTSFNGSTGPVEGVASFNGVTGGITTSGLHLHVAGLSVDVGITFSDGTTMSTAFTTPLKSKLDAIEASADVTDATNVTSAGALMDSELASIANVKALDQSVVSGASPTFGTANFTDASNKRLMTDAQESKLDGVEASADVTDTTNVTSAGALMDSELASIANVKALDQSVVSGASPTFGTANFTDASNKRLMTDAQESKLDGVEASADVTDTTNVTSAGALMDSELASIADVKALDQSVISGASPTFGTANFTDASNKRFMTDAQESKLDGITQVDTFGVVVDGAGSIVTVGPKGHRFIPYACTITNVVLVGDTSGTADFHVYRDSNFTLSGTTLGGISLGGGQTLASITGFTTGLVENDMLEFKITGSPENITRLSLFIEVEKT